MEVKCPFEEQVLQNFKNEIQNENTEQRTEAANLQKDKLHVTTFVELQEQLQEVLERINRIKDTVSKTFQGMVSVPSNNTKDFVDSEKYTNRIKLEGADTLPTKQFLERNSLLTDLFEIKHIRTIYNIIVSTLIILVIHTAVYDIRHTGKLNMAMDTVRAGFGKISVVFYIWFLMKASVLGVYTAFSCWANYHLEFSPKSFVRKVWDYMWLAGIILFQILFIVLPTKAVCDNDLPLASSMIVLMEQLRLVMKTHAFIRSVAPRFLSYKPHSETPSPQMPSFSNYLYFLFAPTLIYQDTYPRTKKIRWKFVLINVAEVLTVVFFVALVYERLLFPNYRNFGKEPIEMEIVILNILSSILPGIILFVSGFYLLLHSWMNAFAEVLRFADKMFYKDWWNSMCYSVYYRTWNIVVHDWLYMYIYKDMYEIVTPRNRKLSVCAVFAISAIFHEYILCFSVRFFYPIMLLLFGGLGLIVFVLKTAGNVFVWFSLSSGCGMMVSMYCMEYFARFNCPQARDDFWDYVLPRTWACMN